MTLQDLAGEDTMRACASASGGVIFVPEEIERENKPVSYSEFVEQEAPKAKLGLFGKKPSETEDKDSSKVA